MIWFYRILFIPLLVLASPYYLWRMLRRGGYSEGFIQRFGLFPALPPKTAGRRRIWIQAVSVGEIEAIGPLLQRLQATGQTEVILTTTTSTGYRIAQDKYKDLCIGIGFFPLDFWPFSLIAWSRIAPDKIILAEGELWPEHLQQAKNHNVPAYLINARLSDKSFARHQKFKSITKNLLKQFSWIGAGSEEDARRLKTICDIDNQIEVTGNLKFDVSADGPLSMADKNKLRSELGFGNSSETIVLLGSSTWEGEEAVLVKALKSLRDTGVDARLLLVPRHAERRDSVLKLLESSGLNYHQRSVKGPQAPEGTIIHLGDTTGELRQLTRAADLAFTGKSLPPHDGGQTPIECAAAGVPVIYGPHMTNFKSICQGLEKNRAAIKCTDADEVLKEILTLSRDRNSLAKMSTAGVVWHKSNQGATERTLNKLLS
jgi:3-deoxy-D-manno-octulosonic-acid transferase